MARFALSGASVLQFTAGTGSSFVPGHAILVDGDRIAGIVAESAVPSDWPRVQAGDGRRWVVPGLIDTHLHLAHDADDITHKTEPDAMVTLRMHMNARLNLRSGVTALRDVGAKHHTDVVFRNAQRKGLIVVPFVFVSGMPITMTGGHCYYMGREADGPDDVARAVREQLKVDVDWIKLMVTGGVMTPGMEISSQQMTDVEIATAVSIATMAGKPVAAHAEAGPGVTAALRAGVRTLEHGVQLGDTDIELMLERNTYYIPTLSAFTQVVDDGANLGLPAYAIEKARAAVEVHCESFRRALAAGVRIAVGTDLHHGTILVEMRRMHELGMPIDRVLHAATAGAAQAIGQHESMGDLGSGKYANLIVVDADPLHDLGALERIRRVYLAGQMVWEDARWLA